MSSAITDRLLGYFKASSRTCLFAGAGVGKRVGFPLWDEYATLLAMVAETYEPETAALMRKRISAGLYLEALHLYKTCVVIPSGTLYENLARPFCASETCDPSALNSLLTLPFAAVVTTNFDRSLHDCYHKLATKPQAARHVELGDASLRQAVYWNDFFIARVHGRAEIPESMVLDTDDYKRTENDAAYSEFLVHILKTYRCLWIGYSFVDPALMRIFALMTELLPQPYPGPHLALVPTDAAPDLRAKLAKFNVEMVSFDPERDAHELWESIRDVAKLKGTIPERVPGPREAMPGLGRIVASAYARLRMARRIEPLREVVAEGIVAQCLSPGKAVSRQQIVSAVKVYVGLPDSAVANLVDDALERLLKQGVATEKDGQFVATDALGASELDLAVKALADGVLSRMKVREGIDATDNIRSIAQEGLLQLLLTRGWDLGAHYAGGRRDDFDAWDQIDAALAPLIKTPAHLGRKALHYAMLDLLRRPDDTEAAILSDVGRVAFAVELVVNNSRTVIATNPFIPETIYLDANVAMPAIVDGHPYGPVYADSIARVQSAANSLGVRLKVTVAHDFLNEVVAHRRRAVEMVKELRLDDPEQLRGHIQFYGADCTNVYVGAYGSWVGRGESSITFAEFLDKVAPYETEAQLDRYLGVRGVFSERLTFPQAQQPLLQAVEDALELFSQSNPRSAGPKAHILRSHEARQLTQLLIHIEQRRPVLFVTADKSLLRAATGPVLGNCATAITSHLAFVQLVDLMLGVSSDKQSLVRLMWNVHVDDTRTLVRNYLIDRALNYYDEARAMAQWQVIERISDDAVEAAEIEGIALQHGGADAARNAKFLDRFEKQFYKNMEAVIREAEQRE